MIQKHAVEFAIGLSLATVLASVGMVFFMIKMYVGGLKKRLYHDDGTTVYLPRSEFERIQIETQRAYCRKVDDILEKLKDMDKSREEAREKWLPIIGRMEGHMNQKEIHTGKRR